MSPAAADAFVVTTSFANSDVAGTVGTVTVTAVDQFGNPASSAQTSTWERSTCPAPTARPPGYRRAIRSPPATTDRIRLPEWSWRPPVPRPSRRPTRPATPASNRDGRAGDNARFRGHDQLRQPRRRRHGGHHHRHRQRRLRQHGRLRSESISGNGRPDQHRQPGGGPAGQPRVRGAMPVRTPSPAWP